MDWVEWRHVLGWQGWVGTFYRGWRWVGVGNGIFWGLGVDGRFLWVVVGRWGWMGVYFVWIVVGGHFYGRWEEVDLFYG